MFVGKGPLAPLLLATAPYLYHYKHYRGKVWATMGYSLDPPLREPAKIGIPIS